MTARIAVLPGTYDPVTLGHLDIIERGAELYDELVVAVSENSSKNPLLPISERLRLIKLLTRNKTNIRAESFSGMTVDFVKKIGAHVILRGIRTFADFEYEFQLALANKQFGGFETVFIMSSAERSFVRSTLIKEAVALGGDMSQFVPVEVMDSLKKYLENPLSNQATVGLGGDDPPHVGKKGSGLRGEGLE